MANTYTQLYAQIIFAVKNRENLIVEKHREKVEKYICGIISKQKSKVLAIYCNPDHIHILVGLNPSISISDLSKLIKSNSSKWINENDFVKGKFSWQSGYSSFSYSKSQIDSVVKYILRQPEHHEKKTFKEEYLKILQNLDIKYEEKYLFDWLD